MAQIFEQRRKQGRIGARIAGLAGMLVGVACSSESAGPGGAAGVAATAAAEPVAHTESALSSGTPYLYFECNATGWHASESNRLKPTANPSIFTLSYAVTQSWLVGSPDRCLVVATNQLDGYGTTQVYYSDPNPAVAVATPGTGALVNGTQDFAVSYPALGNYEITVNTQQNTFSVASATGVVGDCGIAPEGSNASVMVDYVLVYSSTHTRWCVDANMWAVPANAAAISTFFAYGDAVYAQLESLFDITPAPGPFIYQVTDPTGGACDGCSAFGNFGETVTGDAFTNVFDDPVTGAPIPGFYGYLLTLHEEINAYTGLIAEGGWPVDWWADHRSPFPNTIDEYAMRTIGTQLNNPTLLAAANAQHERMAVPTLPGYDPEVAMFNTIYNQDGGFAPFENAFNLIQKDGLVLHTVDANADPSPLLTEYTIAYLQLGIRTTTDLTQSLFVASGVGTLDTTITPYTVDSNAVRAIAGAHCSIAAAEGAGTNVSAELAQLQVGNYAAAVASGGSASTCPAECAWNAATARCVAPW